MGSLANNGAHGVTHSVGRKLRRITAVFTLDAAADPVITSHTTLRAAGLSAAVHQGTGLYRFTLVDNGAKLIKAAPHWLAVANNTDLYAQGVKMAADTDSTFDVQTKTGANNTDPPASPNGGALSIDMEWECG